MKFFIDINGIIFNISKNGKCNHPAEIKVESDKIHILDGEGFISDTYTLWDSLHSLAVAISPKVELDVGDQLSLHDAIEELHQSTEKFREEWLEGHKNKPEHYPLSMPSDNVGLFTEQFIMSLNNFDQ